MTPQPIQLPPVPHERLQPIIAAMLEHAKDPSRPPAVLVQASDQDYAAAVLFLRRALTVLAEQLRAREGDDSPLAEAISDGVDILGDTVEV